MAAVFVEGKAPFQLRITMISPPWQSRRVCTMGAQEI